MYSLFIDEDYLKDNSPISANVDIAEIYPHAKTAEDIYIQEAIGGSLTRYLKGILAASPQVVSDADQEILDLIRDAMVWYTSAEAVPFIWLKIRNIGLVKQSGDNMEAASQDEMDRLVALLKTKGVFYINRLIAFLCVHGAEYEEYNQDCWSCGEISPSGGKKTSVDLFLGGGGYKKNPLSSSTSGGSNTIRGTEDRITVTTSQGIKYINISSAYDQWILDLIAAATGSVDSVNGQTGVVVLGAADVGAEPTLGFTPENVANKQTDLTASAIKYPTVDAVNAGLAAIASYSPLNGVIFPGLWKANGFYGAKTTTSGFNAIIYYTPYFITKQHTITDIGIEVSTGVAGQNVRLALYADNGSGAPGALIEDSGNIASTPNGFKSFTLVTPRQLNPSAQLVWLATQCQVAMSVRHTTSGLGTFLGNNLTGNNGDTVTEAFVTYGAFPANANHSTHSNLTIVWFVKVQ